MIQHHMMFALAAAMLTCTGCTDRAEADYDKCVTADKAKDIAGAWAACSKAVELSAESPKGKLATAKLEDLRPRYQEWQTDTMTVLTEQWCAGLVEHLIPKVAAFMQRLEAEKPPSIRAAATVIEAMALDYAKTKATSCKDDVFYKRNVGYWKCQWLADIGEADDCKEDARE